MSDLGWTLIGWIGYIVCALLGGVYLKKLYGDKQTMHIAYACVSAALLIAGALVYRPVRTNVGIWLMMPMLTIISMEDIVAHRVSNKILIIMLAVGILFALVSGAAILPTVLAPVLYGVIFIVMSLVSKGALGMGDAKLMAVMSVYYGIVGMFSVIFAASLIECLISIVVLIRTKNMRSEIPFVPAIELGAIVALFWFV